MPISDPHWPPDEYDSDIFPPPWLRLGKEYPGSDRPSRLVGHSAIPYVVEIDGEDAKDFLQESLKTTASQYLRRLSQLLGDNEIPVPLAWQQHLEAQLGPSTADTDAAGSLRWLDIWPPIGAESPGDVPLIASWNLSRNDNHALPGPIMMVATEIYSSNGTIAGFDTGVRVPLVVKTRGTRARPVYRVIIRSMTAEFPSSGRQSATELLETVAQNEFPELGDALIPGMASRSLKPDILEKIATKARVIPRSIRHNQITFMRPTVPRVANDPITIRLMSHAVRSGGGHPAPESVQVISDIRFAPGQDPQVMRSQTCSLSSHAAAPGEAMVFSEVPSSSPMHLGVDNPYNWMQRRPPRKDSILMRYRTARDFAAGTNPRLENSGFKIRLCPWYVPDDDAAAKAGDTVKTVRLPGGQDPMPRRNNFSAISAYASCLDFFDLMASFGHPPSTFVARAQQDLQVFYRWGISPGPGRGGKTINAQVTYACSEEPKEETPPKPFINMHLALANLNRFSRPTKEDGTYGRPEPLGIAASGRWMMHEFGHYLLAARIGKLEFDFAHSAGDAMAAIYFDPRSSLNRATPEISAKFRGITYPFVFAPRRHDRSPLTGWAWYGLLNRAILQAPPADCHVTKGYLTEQILSSTLFHLYRSLGGDTMKNGRSDRDVRKRAAHITLFLLIRAIAGLAQSPSRAEMLELGLEDASREMQLALAMPSDVAGLPPWRGGQAQKVVRWAFEAQGMFPLDPEAVVNKSGQPPMVDIYIADQRPDQVSTSAGRETYGPGSYVPVSLDWDGPRLWATAPGTSLQIGNRGSAPCGGIFARFWLGVVAPSPADTRGGTNQHIDWVVQSNFFTLPPPAPGDTADVNLSDLPNLSVELQNLPPAVAPQRLLLLEISCQSDIANTFPLADVMVSIPPGDTPPNTPRELIDLVSSDNNLGLMFLP